MSQPLSSSCSPVEKKTPHEPGTLAVAQSQTPTQAMSVQEVLGQVGLIQEIMKAAMHDGEHFGRVPGCGDKPTLLKPGAEKLCLTFRFAPTYRVDERNYDGGHREYFIQASLRSIGSGAFIGEGVGSCSTREAKYRYRAGAAEATDKPVPRVYWDLRAEDPAKAQELIGGKGFTVRKVDGQGWMIARGGEKVENDNLADSYNTVLKMAKKRALVDAVLTATAASDIFTQDLEDIRENIAATTILADAGAGEETSTVGKPASSSTARGSSGARVSPPARPRPAPAPLNLDAEAPPQTFRETRVHFGRDRGLMLCELSPQQIKWYETDWLPKQEGVGAKSEDDLALIKALKAYRVWRGAERR